MTHVWPVTMKSSQEIDIHFQALCNAVEHEKLEKAKSILEQHPDLRLDTINGDGFTPLDLVRIWFLSVFLSIRNSICHFIFEYQLHLQNLFSNWLIKTVTFEFYAYRIQNCLEFIKIFWESWFTFYFKNSKLLTYLKF